MLGLWRVRMPEAELVADSTLSSDELSAIQTIKSPSRRIEKLAARILLKEMTSPDCGVVYDDFGKPYLKNFEARISISHSNCFVAIITHPTLETGIDIQEISDKIQRIQHKFLAPAESDFVQNNDTEKLLVLWGAKEALYKAHGRRSLIFNEHMGINPFEYQSTGEITGWVKTADFHQRYRLHYQKTGGYMLVYILNG